MNKCEGSQGSPQGTQRGLPAKRAGENTDPELTADLTVPTEAHVYGNSTTPFRNPLKGLCHLDALYKATVKLLSSYCMLDSAEVPKHEALVSGSQRGMRVHRSLQSKVGHDKH